jgi:hypothetical protein
MTKRQDITQVQALVEKPIKYIENVWGQDVRVDPRNRNYDTERSLRSQWELYDRMNTGSLPYSSGPRLLKKEHERMISLSTKLNFSKVCFNKCVEDAGPSYLRYWQIWDSAPFIPSVGDVSIDPRYTQMDTKLFTEPYIVERNVVPRRIF